LRARAGTVAERAQKTLPARVLIAYGESKAGNFALALAFAGFMAMFPLILGALSIIGLAIRDPGTEVRIRMLVLQVFPATAQPELQRALSGVKESALGFGLISLALLIWSASSLFGSLEFALTEIFGTRQRNLFRQRLMGLFMMVVVVIAIVITVAVDAIAGFFPSAWVTSFIAGSAVMVALLVALYRFVPNRKLRLRDVLPGALLAGVLIEVLSLAFPLYARIAGGFNTYGAQFGLFFLLATWFYFLAQFVLLGAVLIRLRVGEWIEPIRTTEYGAETDQDSPPRRSIFQRIALGGVVAAAVAIGVLRRRRPRSFD
jgi:membrane protein